MDYISIDASNHADGRPDDRRSVVVRSAVRIAGGSTLKAAFGVFYKEDKYEYAASPEASVFLDDEHPSEDGESPTYRGSSPRTTSRATTTTSTCTRKLLVPVLRGCARARSRWRRCSATACPTTRRQDSFDSWKAELIYQPVDASGFAAPTRTPCGRRACYELYLPQFRGVRLLRLCSFSPAVDPCTAGSPERTGPDAASVEALCLAQGIPAALLPTFSDPAECDHRSHWRESRPRTGGGRHEHDRAVWTSRRSASAALQPAVVAGLVSHRHQRQDRDAAIFRVRPVLLRRRYNPESLRLEPVVFAVRPQRGERRHRRCPRDKYNASDWETSGDRRAGRLAVRARTRSARRELAGRRGSTPSRLPSRTAPRRARRDRRARSAVRSAVRCRSGSRICT